MHEMVTWSFMKEEEAHCFAPVAKDMDLTNPISLDLSTMRPSLLGHLIKAMQRNKDRGHLPQGVFEVGLDYQNSSPQGGRWCVAAVRSGHYQKRHWRAPQSGYTVYDIKADLWATLEALGVPVSQIKIKQEGNREIISPNLIENLKY
jgi:phenylalanyl-tRNA synthetase beta chain